MLAGAVSELSSSADKEGTIFMGALGVGTALETLGSAETEGARFMTSMLERTTSETLSSPMIRGPEGLDLNFARYCKAYER